MFNVISVCFVIMALGLAGGFAFGLKVLPSAAAGLALIVWTAVCVTSGMVTAFKQLEHVKIHKIIDGEEKCLITLKLGPFGYTIDVPEEKKATEEN